MKVSNPQQQQEMRHTVARYIANRYPAAMTPQTVCDGIRAQHSIPFDFDLDDINSALAFLLDLQMVIRHSDPLGAGWWYRMSATGKTAADRFEI